MTSRRSAGQAAIEAVVVVPMCLVCSMFVVDAGILAADQLAIERAATRAGDASIAGDDPATAAAAALPRGLRHDLRVARHDGRLEMSVPARGLVLSRIAPLRLHAAAATQEAGPA